MSEGCIKIRKGTYSYRGFTIQRIGYYEPDKKVVWEAYNSNGDADYHGYSKREVKNRIIESLKKK